MTKVYSHLSAQERIRIDELRNRDGLGVCQIALRIGRDKSTVNREPGRGLWVASDENGSYRPYRPKRLKTGAWTSRPFYSAMTVQRKAETRARESRRPCACPTPPPLPAWVMDALRKGWTPELIEGRLKVEWPDDPRMRISHECLYRWIYAKPQRALGLRRYLPRSKRHRTRSKGRKARGPRIPMRVPITDRPKKVDSRHLQAIVREINDTPHEGPGLGNAQRGLVPQARQGNVKDKPPKDECCTYKLNPGRREVIPIASDKFVVK